MIKIMIFLNIIFFLFISISMPVKIVEIEKEVVRIDTIVLYKSVYDWQIYRRHEIKNEQVVRNMDIVASRILQPIQMYANRYRGKKTNLNVISFCRDWNKGSQHVAGKAIDIDMDVIYKDFGNKEIFDFIRRNLEFDQLIAYRSLDNPTSIHVSYDKDRNRGQVYLGIKRKRKRMYYKRIK